MDRIKKEDLITGNMLHYQYMDVNDLVRVFNELIKEVNELRRVVYGNKKD